jgi:hypothetical protein
VYAADDTVEPGERTGRADDGLVQVSRGVVVGVEVLGEFGAELVDRNPGVEQLGLYGTEGLMFDPFNGVGV